MRPVVRGYVFIPFAMSWPPFVVWNGETDLNRHPPAHARRALTCWSYPRIYCVVCVSSPHSAGNYFAPCRTSPQSTSMAFRPIQRPADRTVSLPSVRLCQLWVLAQPVGLEPTNRPQTVSRFSKPLPYHWAHDCIYPPFGARRRNREEIKKEEENIRFRLSQSRAAHGGVFSLSHILGFLLPWI